MSDRKCVSMKKFADWSKAPNWANYHTVDQNGVGRWWQVLPTPEYRVWFSDNSNSLLSGRFDLDGIKWDNTLEVRPTEIGNVNDSEPANNAQCMLSANKDMMLTPVSFLLHESNNSPWCADAIDIQIQDHGEGIFLVLSNLNDQIEITPQHIECLAQNLPTMLARFNRC